VILWFKVNETILPEHLGKIKGGSVFFPDFSGGTSLQNPTFVVYFEKFPILTLFLFRRLYRV